MLPWDRFPQWLAVRDPVTTIPNESFVPGSPLSTAVTLKVTALPSSTVPVPLKLTWFVPGGLLKQVIALDVR